jgi:uncharacterized metal-binding protein
MQRARGARSKLAALAIFVGVAGAALASGARAARANGAFPDSQSVVAPADRPRELLLATNFGLVLSHDGGASWTWSCEQDATAFAYLFQSGPTPLGRLFALSVGRLVYSDSGGCGWAVAGGALAGHDVTDAFPDPIDASRVFAVAHPSGAADGQSVVMVSYDGGATFQGAIYTAASQDDVTGVEVARSAPDTIYLTITGGPGFVPKLARTVDGGASWQTFDLSGALGAAGIWLVAIDPQRPDRVLLRVAGAAGEGLAITDDGGVTARLALALDGGNLTGVARLDSGTLVAAAAFNDHAALYRSTDDGSSFQPQAGAPHVRGLAARGDLLFAAADDFGDGFALGISNDEGISWQAGMRYDQVTAIDGCVQALCHDSCLSEADLSVWPAAVCDAPAPTPSPPPSTLPAQPPVGQSEPASGCACALERGRPRPGLLALLDVALIGHRRSRRRGRRRDG